MVPTGKQTPIEPAEPLPPNPVVPLPERRAPAPVSEYTAEYPEPPPLDPSYVPVHFNYIQYLSPHAIVYVRNQPTSFFNYSRRRVQMTDVIYVRSRRC